MSVLLAIIAVTVDRISVIDSPGPGYYDISVMNSSRSGGGGGGIFFNMHQLLREAIREG